MFFVSIPIKLKDGGSIEYKSLVYEVTKVYRAVLGSKTAYADGIIIEIFEFSIFNNAKAEFDVTIK